MSGRARGPAGARALLDVAAVASAAACAHGMLLAVAALRPSREDDDVGPDPGPGGRRTRFAVLVPAHDEAAQIAPTLAALARLDYPTGSRRVIVLADNCTDATAAVARESGIEVWEREDRAHRGKGHALAWGFARLRADPEIDAVCVIDADCLTPTDLLDAFDRRFSRGAEACQAGYAIADPESSTGAALRWAGFALFNRIRPLGRERLGLSCGLLGTGMAFSSGLLAAQPWEATSFAEDREQHLRWVLGGVRVRFCPEVVVMSAAAPDAAASDAQEARWESGRGALVRELSPALLARGLRERDPAALDAALEPILPPQSLLLALSAGVWLLGWSLRAPAARRLAGGALVGQVGYVVAGLRAVRAPPAVWWALLRAPGFVARRLRVLTGAAFGGGPAAWVRTPR